MFLIICKHPIISIVMFLQNYSSSRITSANIFRRILNGLIKELSTYVRNYRFVQIERHKNINDITGETLFFPEFMNKKASYQSVTWSARYFAVTFSISRCIWQQPERQNVPNSYYRIYRCKFTMASYFEHLTQVCGKILNNCTRDNTSLLQVEEILFELFLLISKKYTDYLIWLRGR